MEKHKAMIWIILFMIIISSPSFVSFFLGQYVDSENYENRNTQTKPLLTIKNYETFPKDYEAYYNDNLPFRNQLIRLNNSIDYFIFKQSSNKDVVIGKNGWLFYCNGAEGNPIEQSLGYWDFSDDELQAIANNLVYSKRVLESEGVEFVLFIAPNKETIYAEELPDYYQIKSTYTSTDHLIDYLKEKTDIRVVYPKNELLNIKDENSDIMVYHKLDTHWNSAGGYIGAKCLAKELGIEMPQFGEISLSPILSSNGDLTNMLNIVVKDGDIDYDISDISILNTKCEKRDFATEFIYHTPKADSRKLFVCRDSFSSALAPILATQFEDSIWVHKKSFEQQQIFDYNTDIFVLEIVERNERQLIDFRISYISSIIESDKNGTKNVMIVPEIRGDKLQYVSIFKKNFAIENLETIQLMEALNETMTLNIPADESGEIYIYVYEDASMKEIIDEITIEY